VRKEKEMRLSPFRNAKMKNGWQLSVERISLSNNKKPINYSFLERLLFQDQIINFNRNI